MLDASKTAPAADLQAAWREGARAVREGRAADALVFFRQITDAGQANSAVWIGLAIAHLQLGDRGAERAALTEVLRRDSRDLRALLMIADNYAAAQEARAADSYYAAFVKLAEATGDAALKPEIARAQGMRAQYTAAYEAHLHQALGDHALGQPSAGRMRRALDLMLGKSELYLQQPRNFYFPELPNIQYADRAQFPWMDRIEAATGAIRAELMKVLEGEDAFSPYIEAEPNRPSFDDAGVVGNPDWSAFYLWRFGAPVPGNAERCPATLDALAEAPLCQIPGRTPAILFSLLRPGMHIAPHHGFMNTRYICHLPLIVPEGCAMRVGSDTRSWTEGQACVFDDSIEHEAWNRHPDRLRVVLIFDVWRPELTPAERAFVSSVLNAADTYGQGDPSQPLD